MNSSEPLRFQRVVGHYCSEPCRSCGTDYVGNFCPHCGQEAAIGAPTSWAMIYEFLTRNVFERGKLVRTLWRLVRHPGALTVDFLEGRRQNYIRPVRLYFSLSLLMFLLMSFQNVGIESELIRGFRAGASSAETAAAAKNPAALALAQNAASASASPYFTKMAARLPPGALRQRVSHLAALPEEQRWAEIFSSAGNKLPRTLFVLMPAFAFLLMRLFATRTIPFGAHLLFSLHFHCVLFLSQLLSFIVPAEIDAMTVPMTWVWLLLALHHTYLCRWWSAIWRWLILSVLYPVLLLFAGGLTVLAGILF